ncbi:hypothetical protein EST92_29870 [Streptomyces sp. TM32]|uniref:hypothetical protein n=1 Tax=Streptomyces sp. TM32 TaxID=1652669 RepID=UPI0010113B1C|nr:hypothetical protein [Streptomyces sp. TM32]RXS65372.1 hypothetical protein EST92_29870 [Streptomyces sp. TM32]
MVRIPTAAVAATGLVGGYAVARWTKQRAVGGVALAAAGAVAARGWQQKTGNATAAALSGMYVAAFAASHPLAKKIGAWPSVCAVAGGVAAASWCVADRRKA